MANTDLNVGSNIQTQVDENLVPQQDTSSPSPAAAAGDFGVAESVTDIDLGVSTQSLVDSIPDVSLTSGVNIDNFFSLGGGTSFGGLTNVFSEGFSLDSIADQFGVTGLLGNLPIDIDLNVAPKLDPELNVLHRYASHTYRITMGAQSIADHNEIQDEGFVQGTPKITTLMMASGGDQYVDGVCRDPIFKEDFYIEDLRMHTIIGSNAQGNGSNSVNLEFTIMEPYAVSLIERLLALANKLNYENYIEIPYVFKIEFIGYDDEGNPLGVIPNTTKYIPFRLTYMDLSIKGQGALYECTAIPVNHFAFNQTVAAIPEALEIAAGNLGEFFNGAAKGNPHNNTTSSLVDTINGFHNKLVASQGNDAQANTARDKADRINVILHPDIAAGNLEVASLSKVGMLNPDVGFQPNRQFPQPAKPLYGFHAGTSITSIISDMIKNSTFYLSQIEEHERIDQENRVRRTEASNRGRAYTDEDDIPKKPMINFKITSSYKMLEYDHKANRHAYEATFYVNPYEVRATQSTLMGRSEVENIAKEYDYLFTGQNQDILGINLNFNLAFYNSLDANTESAGEGAQASTTKPVSGADQGNNSQNSCDKLTRATAIEHQQASAKDNTGTLAKEDRKKLKAASFRKSIMQDSAGDMVTFDMEILGDPAFIKQDDVLYRADAEVSNAKTENGSIKQDNGDMYIRLRFKVFDDIDHNTGLRVEGRQIPDSTFNRKSTFDGFYRVMQLENVFSSGRFTQNLVVMRTYVQEDCDPESESVAELTNSLVAFQEDPLDAFGGAGAAVVSSTLPNTSDFACGPFSGVLTNAQSVVENAVSQGVKEGTDYVNSAFEEKDEELTTPADVGEVNADSVVEITTREAFNADRSR